MANNCWYNMRVVGTKADCYEWLARLKHESDCGVPLGRFFDADICGEAGTEQDYELDISGDCAWSVSGCRYDRRDGADAFAANTKELNLQMEVWSEECGCAFQEHIIYKYGDCITDNCVEWHDYCIEDYNSYEEFAKEYGDNISQEAFDEAKRYGKYYVSCGGFDDYCEYSIHASCITYDIDKSVLALDLVSVL